MKKKRFSRGKRVVLSLWVSFVCFYGCVRFLSIRQWCFFMHVLEPLFKKSDGKNDCRKKVIEKEATEQSDSKTLFH